MISILKEELISLRKKVLEKVFERMNPVQMDAVFTTQGPLLILAGAGSGKTTVVVNRIANLIKFGQAYNSNFISNQIDDEDANAMNAFLEGGTTLDPELSKKLSVSAALPWRVMAITFTNKAANELKERLVHMLGDDGNEIWASTFHSSCARMLRKDADRIGYSKHFTIYDTDDSRRLMKECLKKLDVSEKVLPPKSALAEISRAKDSLTSPNEYLKNAGSDYRLQLIGKAYKMYQSDLKKADAMDFDDLISKTVELFESCPDVLEYYQNRFEYIMVDEYQDTNQAQYRFIRLLAERRQNICVVGDDDQSIYKFRGATIENILNFENNFDKAKVVRLEQNYRSTGNILTAANGVIKNNSNRKGKNLWTAQGEGEPIIIHTASDERDEADNVANEILSAVKKGRDYSDFAVLYRMNSQSLSFERMFAKQGIPHRILGGTRFYERAEVKDMLAYLAVINNPNDTVRLRRIINKPTRGIGDKTIELIASFSETLGIPYLEVINNCHEYPTLSRASKKLQEFAKLMNELIEFGANPENSIDDLYRKIPELTDYANFIKADEPEKLEEKRANIMELSSNIRRYEEECLAQDKEPSLSEFLEEISLIADIDNYDTQAKAVTLMTVHSAKGLEFPVVFLPGWEENVFPGISVMSNPSEAEEERRLAYVAITRAREKLYIYNARQRMVFGSTNRNMMSRFTSEIPDTCCEKTSSGFESPFTQVTKTGVTNTIRPSFEKKVPNSYKPTTIQRNTETFSEGDRVSHRTFGEGVILSTRPMGNDTLLEIAFESSTKLLGANFAKLKKI